MKNLTEKRFIYEIAKEIKKDWGQKVYFGAVPYLNAMFSLSDLTDYYGQESAKSIINHFLANAATWRGEKARQIKNELKTMIK